MESFFFKHRAVATTVATPIRRNNTQGQLQFHSVRIVFLAL